MIRVESSLVKTNTPGRSPTNERVITMAEVLPREQVVQAASQAPQPGDPVLGRDPQSIWL